MFYELVYIVRPDAGEQAARSVAVLIASILEKAAGRIVKEEVWGVLPMAYPIKKSKRGYYMLLGIEASAAAIKSIEQRLQINEDMLRLLVLRVEKFTEGISPGPGMAQDTFVNTRG